MITSCSRCKLPCDTTWHMGVRYTEISQCCRAPVVRTWTHVDTKDTHGHT